MASKKTLNAKNLETLGAPRLAALLMEISTGNAAAKRRLRLELAEAEGPGAVANEVRKRLAAIGRSRSFVDARDRKALVIDLETQRRAIVEQVGLTNPVGALELMWRFVGLANAIFDRCDDGSGTVIGIFRDACEELGEIALEAPIGPEALADRAFDALVENDYGQYDALITNLAPALGPQGLEHLKRRVMKFSEAPVETPDEEDRAVIGWSSAGPIYADEMSSRRRDSMVRMALQDIADVQGDVDGYIAQKSDQAKAVPAVAAGIAGRLLAAGRVEEAWTAINAVDEHNSSWIPLEWEQVRLAILEALGRTDEAQSFRWACFEKNLNPAHLRDYLALLPDFDDVDAEVRALSLALDYPNVHQALAFLVTWPDLDKAAQLAVARREQLDGYHYELLTPAAEALAARHPVAATILLRTMIDFALEKGRTARYRHAARHLSQCESLAQAIDDFGEIETHDAYAVRLRKEHGRKTSFWGLVRT